MKRLSLFLALVAIAALAYGQAPDRQVRDIYVLRVFYQDSSAMPSTPSPGRMAIVYRGNLGLYLLTPYGAQIRLDQGGSGTGSADSVAHGFVDTTGRAGNAVYLAWDAANAKYVHLANSLESLIDVDLTSPAAGDMLVSDGTNFRNQTSVPTILDTNHVPVANPAGDTLRTYLGWLYRQLDSLMINGYLSKVKAIRFSDGTTMSTAAAGGSVSDAAYGASWDGVTTTAPSKNATYDKLAALSSTVEAIQIVDTLLGKPILWTDITQHTEPEPGDMVQFDGTYWRQKNPLKFVRLVDDFFGFAPESGELGELGWSLKGTVTMTVNSVTGADANHPGQVHPVSTAATGVHVMSLRNETGYPVAQFQDVDAVTFNLITDNTGTDFKARFGLFDDGNDDTPAYGVYFERDAAETNWRFVTATGSSETRTDIAQSVSSTVWRTYTVTFGDSIRCYVDGNHATTHANTTGPAATDGVNACFVINPTAAVARGFYVDYFSINLSVTR